jgi:hypothetical protein
MELHKMGRFQNKIVLLGQRHTTFQDPHVLLVFSHILDGEEGRRRMIDNGPNVCTLFDPTSYFWTIYKQTGEQPLSPYPLNIPCDLETFLTPHDEHTFPYAGYGIPHSVWQHAMGMVLV